MIESLNLLGNLYPEKLQDNNRLIESMVEEINITLPKKENEYKKLLKIVFDLNESLIKFDYRDINEEDVYNFSFVGNAKSSSSPPWRVTRNEDVALVKIGSIFLNLINNIELRYTNYSKLNLYNLLKYTYDLFFIEKTLEKKGKEINGSYLNSSMFDVDIELDYSECKSNDKDKYDKEFLTTVIKPALKSKELDIKNIGLYTISIIDKDNIEHIVAQDETYKEMLVAEIFKYDMKEDTKYKCHICGKYGCLDKVTFKYAIFQTTKTNFAFNLDDKNYNKNFSLCRECYKKVRVGEALVKREFSIKMGGNDIFVLPNALILDNDKDLLDSYEDAMVSDDLGNRFEENIKIFKKSISTQDQFKRMSDFKEDMFDIVGDNFYINLIFNEQSQASTKISNVIRNIDGNYFLEVINTLSNVNMIYYLYLENSSDAAIKKASLLFRRDFTSILNKRKLNRALILRDALVKIRKKYYENKKELPLNEIKNLHNYLQKLEVLNLMKKTEEPIIQLDKINILEEDVVSKIHELKLTSTETGLFLLGCLVHEVASKQYKKSQNKAILNSLDMRGMGYREVLSLEKTISQKIIQLELDYPNINSMYYIATSLLTISNKECNFKKYSKEEILNFIFLGYTYGIHKSIEYSKLKKLKSEEETSNEKNN